MKKDPNLPSEQSEAERIDAMQTWREQCLLFLFGELSGSALDDFQTSLGESELKVDVLAEVAETISLVAFAAPSPVVTKQTDFVRRRTVSNSRWIAALVAISTCVLFAFLLGKGETTARTLKPSLAEVRPHVPNEERLVAEAWAETLVSFDDEISSSRKSSDVTIDFEESILPSDDDVNLSWLVAGMETGTSGDG